MVGKFTWDSLKWTLGFGSSSTSRTSSSTSEAFAERPLQRVAWTRSWWSPWRWTFTSWRWRWRWKRSPSRQQTSPRTSWAMQLWELGWSCNPVRCIWRTPRSWTWRRTAPFERLTICQDWGLWICELCGKPWCFGERGTKRSSTPWWNNWLVFFDADVTWTFGHCRCPWRTGISTWSCRGGWKRCDASSWSWSSASVGWEHACTCTTWRHTSWSCCWITCSCRTLTWTSCSWKSPWRFTTMSTCFDGLEKWWKRSTAWDHGWATELFGSTLTTAEAEVFTSAPWNRSLLRRSRILANWDGHVVACTRRAKRSPTSTQHGRAAHVAGYACAMSTRRPTREIPELLDLLRTLWWRPSWSCRTTSMPGRWQRRSSMENWWRSRADTWWCLVDVAECLCRCVQTSAWAAGWWARQRRKSRWRRSQSPWPRPRPKRRQRRHQGSSHLHQGLRGRRVVLPARTMRSLLDQLWTSAAHRSLWRSRRSRPSNQCLWHRRWLQRARNQCWWWSTPMWRWSATARRTRTRPWPRAIERLVELSEEPSGPNPWKAKICGYGHFGYNKCPQQLEAAEGNVVSPQPTTLTSTRQSSTMSPMTTCTTKNSESTEVPKDDKNTCGHFGRIESEMDEMFNVTEKTVRPSLAKRLAKAAMLTTALMGPMRELIGAVQPQIDIMEIACSPESALTQEFVDNGFTGMRINYRNGFDLDSKKGTSLLVKEIKKKHPKLAWVSMVCTRMSSLQNLTPRTPEQQDRFLKRKGQDLRRCDDVVTGLEEVLQHGDDLAWEWPSTAVSGWRSRPLQRLQKLIKRYNRQIYWINIDGCQYGLKWRGWPVKKAWTILTTNRNLWLTLNKKCDGTHEHVHCRGQVAQASSFYPPKMCKDICKAMKFSWMQQIDSLENMVEHYMLEIDNDLEETFDPGLHRHRGEHHQHHALPLQALPGRREHHQHRDLPQQALPGRREHHQHRDLPQQALPGRQEHHRHHELPLQALHGPQEQALALSRTRLQLETAPTGKKLEAVKQLLLRVHRASGHSGMSNLVRLLKARGAPPWALELAQRLRCPECEEAAKPLPRPPASLGEAPAMFEILGTDVFEFEMPEKEGEPNMKMKFILWRDRASGLTMIDHMQTFESKRAWEPTSQDVIKSMMKWQMVYPSPKWVMSDAARYYTSEEFMDYLNRGGIGLTVAPAEAHWLMGSEESAIGVAKRTVLRLMKEESKFNVPDLFTLAAAAMNSHVGANGFSAYQWAFGSGGGVLDDEKLLPGIQPGKAFQGLVKERERAKIAFERERATERFSKLANSVGRQASQYKPGQLVMVWRQRVKPGKMKGSWTGPVRLILMEGTTAWLSSGSTLIRAKVNQIRPVSSREEMTSILEGTAVYKTPVSVESLMRSFQGRYYKDISGDTPSEELQRQDLGPSQVLQEPVQRQGQDSWSLEEKEGKRVLVRKHVLPRLALFNPLRAANCPVSLDEMTGERKTIVRPLHGGEAEINDTVDIQRNLQDRWTGETRFELLQRPLPPPKRQRVPDPKGSKRKAEKELSGEEDVRSGERPHAEADDEEKDPLNDLQGDDALQQPAQDGEDGATSLTQTLRSKGPNVLDGTPITSSAGSSSCVAPGCDLPGGHLGHHRNNNNEEFLYDPYDGSTKIIAEEKEPSTPSSSSTSSEELQPDLPGQDPKGDGKKNKDDFFVAVPIDLNTSDWKWLSKPQHRRKADVWLSKKMSDKSKEVIWQKLPLNEKKEYDIAMAKELSNVIISKALRRLSKEELKSLDPKRLMSMRWVLTRKSDGSAKARLVVLGFMAPNITEVESASPTMSKTSRNLVLAVASCMGFILQGGDVTSAFLQTGISLEDEMLDVWAPPELVAMFGAEDGEGMALRVREAFYGLVHAPRKWFEKCVATLVRLGWKQLKGDRCVFILMEDDQLVAIAGLHVDDFLVAGSQTSQKFLESEQELLKAFRWGKWQTGEFEFAGCELKQLPDNSVILSQEKYTERWMEEITIDKSSSRKAVLTPEETSALRGALGTISWRSTQSAPQFLAETSLLLSEINKGTVETLYKVNKLVREMRREAKQGLLFPAWGIPWSQLACVTWADASQHNRPDKSSTVGIVTAIGPKEMLEGAEVQLAVVQWKSGKTPRQVLGSNGAETQAITIGEDQNFNIRMLMAEIGGANVEKGNVHEVVKTVDGAVVMDSRGIYDAMTKNVSPLHGLRESRAGYELTLAVNNGVQAGTRWRWVNGLAQLGDSLTKAGARKAFLQFLSQRQFWRLVDDPKFESGRKVHKREMERKLREMEEFFINEVRRAAEKNNLPWNEGPIEKYHPLLWVKRLRMYGWCNDRCFMHDPFDITWDCTPADRAGLELCEEQRVPHASVWPTVWPITLTNCTNIKGVYWWDPWHTLYGSTMDPAWVILLFNIIQSANRPFFASEL